MLNDVFLLVCVNMTWRWWTVVTNGNRGRGRYKWWWYFHHVYAYVAWFLLCFCLFEVLFCLFLLMMLAGEDLALPDGSSSLGFFPFTAASFRKSHSTAAWHTLPHDWPPDNQLNQYIHTYIHTHTIHTYTKAQAISTSLKTHTTTTTDYNRSNISDIHTPASCENNGFIFQIFKKLSDVAFCLCFVFDFGVPLPTHT